MASFDYAFCDLCKRRAFFDADHEAVGPIVCEECEEEFSAHRFTYDPRTHVVVPMEAINKQIVDITESPWWDSTEDAGETLYAVRAWLQSLLSTEEVKR